MTKNSCLRFWKKRQNRAMMGFRMRHAFLFFSLSLIYLLAYQGVFPGMNRVMLAGVLWFKEHLQFVLFVSAFNIIISEIKIRNESLRIPKKKVFKGIRTSQVWSHNLVHNFERTPLEWAPMLPNCHTIVALNLAITVTWSLKNMLWKYDVTLTRWEFQEIYPSYLSSLNSIQLWIVKIVCSLFVKISYIQFPTRNKTFLLLNN